MTLTPSFHLSHLRGAAHLGFSEKFEFSQSGGPRGGGILQSKHFLLDWAGNSLGISAEEIRCLIVYHYFHKKKTYKSLPHALAQEVCESSQPKSKKKVLSFLPQTDLLSGMAEKWYLKHGEPWGVLVSPGSPLGPPRHPGHQTRQLQHDRRCHTSNITI